jgi:hypothetical protein
MRVTEIDDILTKGPNEVAFNLDQTPDTALVSSIKLKDGITAKVVGSSLVLKTEYEPLPVKSSHLDNFLDEYHKAEGARAKAQRDAELDRRNMLLRIAHSFNIPLSSEVEDDN